VNAAPAALRCPMALAPTISKLEKGDAQSKVK
jgi:hypothetical protein